MKNFSGTFRLNEWDTMYKLLVDWTRIRVWRYTDHWLQIRRLGWIFGRVESNGRIEGDLMLVELAKQIKLQLREVAFV